MSVLAEELLLCLMTGKVSAGQKESFCFKYELFISNFKHRSCSSEKGIKTGRSMVYGLSLGNHVTFL